MRKKHIMEISIIFLILTIILSGSISYGITTGFGEFDIKDKENVLPQGAENILQNIIYVIALIGSGISIIALIALGIKYMMGSLEERATYKKTLLPYIIGAIFIFGSSILPSIIYNIVK